MCAALAVVVFGNRFEVVVVVVLFFFPTFGLLCKLERKKSNSALRIFQTDPKNYAAAAEGYCRCCSLQLHFIHELFCGSRNPPPPRELWSLLVLVVVLLLHETQ